MSKRSSAKREIESRKQSYLIYVLLGLLTLAVFSQAARFPFINYDDWSYVTANSHVKQGINLRTIEWAFTNRSDANWIPMVWLSLMLDHDAGGTNGDGNEDPTPYHRYEHRTARAQHLVAFHVAEPRHRQAVAKRLRCRAVCRSSAARRVRGLGCGAKGTS